MQVARNGGPTLESSQTNTSQTNKTLSSQQQTIETGFTQFPRLSDFKSATNNIYLKNRPIADPRQEAEYQQALLDNKLKRALPAQVSRAELQLPARKSIEQTLNFQPSVSPSMPTGISALEDNMLMARPRESNMMVVKAYKNQQQQIAEKSAKAARKRNQSSKSKFSRRQPPEEGFMLPLPNMPDV